MMSGRRDLFQRHSGESDFTERFDRLAEDVEKGRIPVKVAADALGISTKSLERAIEKRKQTQKAAITYAKFDKFQQLPGIQKWIGWMKSRYKNDEALHYISTAERFWIEVLQKKSFDLLTEEDIVNGATWAKQQTNGSRNKTMLVIRALIRGQYGKHEWLVRHLSTKGLKTKAAIPPELISPETFREVLPRLFHGLDKLVNDGSATAEEIETMRMVIMLKASLGPRTGNPKEEREVWGCKVNSGKSNLQIDQNGKIVSWTFFAKGGFTWGPIPERMIDPTLKARVEEYVRKHDIKAGDFLVQNMTDDRARILLKAGCKIAGLSKFRLHDFRKMFATAGILGGVPMEVMADLGVGWKDLDTLKEFYVTIKSLNAAAEYDKISGFLKLEAAA